MASVPFGQWVKNQMRCFLNDYPHILSPAPGNILHVTRDVLCSSLNRKSISWDKKYSFIHRKNVFYDTRCSFLFLSQEINFLSQEMFYLSQEKNPFVADIVRHLSQEVFFLSQEAFLVTCVYFII